MNWWLIGLVAYFVSTPFFFLLMYSNGVDLNFRINRRTHKRWDRDTGFVAYHRALFKNAFQLMQRDFLCIHCPWDKNESVRSRIKDLRRRLKSCEIHTPNGMIWHRVDLEFPEFHEKMADECYVSRTRFWSLNLLGFILAPINFVMVIVVAIVITVLLILDWVWEVLTQ